MPISARRRQQGFTYLSLIILVAIIGLVAAAGLKMGALLQRRAAEQELLDIGAAFGDALASYARATPAGQPRQPASLGDLLKDPRFPGVRRHLRKLYVDPITGRAEWGLMYMAGGSGVVGVHSLSDARPIKVGNFEPRFQQFAGKTRFSDWKFTSAELAGQAQAPAAPSLAVPVPGGAAAAMPMPMPPQSPPPAAAPPFLPAEAAAESPPDAVDPPDNIPDANGS